MNLYHSVKAFTSPFHDKIPYLFYIFHYLTNTLLFQHGQMIQVALVVLNLKTRDLQQKSL